MTNPQQPSFGEALPLRYETDVRFTHRFALVISWLTISRSVFAVVAGAIAAIGLLGLLATLLGLFLSAATGEWHDLTTVLLGFVIPAALLALMFGLGYSTARLTLDRQFPIGSVFGAELGETRLSLSMPGSSGEIDYRNYRKVVRVGDFIYLPSRVGMRRTLLPAQLFPGAALDELRARIANARTLT